MDSIENFDENVLQSSDQTFNLIDVEIEAGDSLQHLKYSDDGDTSLEENETEMLTKDEDISLKEQTHDAAQKIKVLNDCVIETSLNATEESIPVVPSAAIISFEGCSIVHPDDNFLETISSENFLKPSLDLENKEVQDEEIQLRWDDDDEEITFNSGIEEEYDNPAHFLENKTSTLEGDNEAFSLQKVKTEEPHDMDVRNVENLIDDDTELKESPKINLNFDTETHQAIETVENEVKDFALDSLETEESLKVNLYSTDLEEFLILKQKPVSTGIGEANILEDLQLELSNNVNFDTVVAKDCHGVHEKKIDSVDEEKKILLEGIGLVESTDVNLDSYNTDNHNFCHTVKEKLTCDVDEGETPLKSVDTDKSYVKESNIEIEITEFSNNIKAKETKDDQTYEENKVSVNHMEINQLPKINLDTEKPEELNDISYCTMPLNDNEISIVNLGDDDKNQFNKTIQYINEKLKNTEDEVRGDFKESVKPQKSTEINWGNSPNYEEMEKTSTSEREDKEPHELNDVTYCIKSFNENEISMVNLGDDEQKQNNNAIQYINEKQNDTENEVKGDSTESRKTPKSIEINWGNSPKYGAMEETSSSESEDKQPNELNDITYCTKPLNFNEISIVNLGDDDNNQLNDTIQYINEKPKNTEDELRGDSKKSVKPKESTEINRGNSRNDGEMERTSTSEREDKQPHELNDVTYCTKSFSENENSMVNLGDDEQKQINNTIQYINEKQNDTENEAIVDSTESMKTRESTEINWGNSPKYGAMEGTSTSESEDKQPHELNVTTYCTKPLNDNEIVIVSLGDDDKNQFNDTIQYINEKPKNTEDEVRGDSKESMITLESTEVNSGNSPNYGEMERTSTSEREDKQTQELNDVTYCTKSFNENEISVVNLSDDPQKQINNTIQYINEKQNDTEDEVKGDSTESMKTPESTEVNSGNSPKYESMDGTSSSESEDKQPHELNDTTYCTKPLNENEISMVNSGDDDVKQFDNTIECINEISKNTEDELKGKSTKSVKKHESNEMNWDISPKYEEMQGTSTSDTEHKQPHDKGEELNLSPKHSIKKITTDSSTEENITIVPNYNKQAEDDSALQDSIVDTSMGLVTQHGLKKPDMMLEIPTKELMNFMDEDDDNLDLLGNLGMSPDYAGVEIGNLEDNIKEVNDPETVSTVPIISNDLDKEMNTVANMSEKIVNTRETSSENVNIDDKTTVKNQMVACTEEKIQLPEITIVVDEPQPSTSKACVVLEMSRDSDEIGEVSDSLGLLAESSRVLEYDEEQDDDEDGDDDEDFDQDEESSNQMVTEYSEESNTIHFESEMPKILQMESDNAQDGGEKENIERYDSEKETELCGFQIFENKSDIPVNVNENLIENNKQTECSIIIPTQEKTNVDENKEMDYEMVPVSAVEQTTEKNLDAHSERLLSDTKEDENKTAKLPLENEDDAGYKNNISIGPCDDIAEVAGEKETSEDDDVVLLDSSSDEDSCHSNEKSSSLSGVEPTDDMSRCSLLTEVIGKPSSDSNLENSKLDKKKIEFTVTSEKKVKKTPTGLELFNVDSDDDETRPKSEPSELEECAWEDEEPRDLTPCVNLNCNSKPDTQYYVADYEVCKFYQADHNGAVVCGPCADYVAKKSEEMIEAIRTFVPLLEMETGKLNKDLVEISDSDTDDDDGAENDGREKIGDVGAKFLEEKLGDMINETWVKFKMQSRFDDALQGLQKDLDVVNAEGEDLDGMLTECQQELDQIRTEFYATFSQERKDLPAIVIYDTPKLMYSSYEDVANSKAEPPQGRMKRRMSAVTDTPAKRLALLPALQYEDELDMTEYIPAASPESVDDDNLDVSVVDMSVETAPADLPPPGDYVRPLLREGMTVYAMRTTYGFWTKAKIVDLHPKTSWDSSFTMCRVRFEHKVARNPFKFLPARCLAYSDPTEFRLIIATRIIASSDTTDSFYSGVVAEVPSPVNGYRYLVFFDDGHAKYVHHANTRLVCECSSLVWEEVHPNSREFVRDYLLSYPERPMVRLHAGQNLKTEWNGQWWNSRVMQVDASLALIMLAGDRMEWIYRGSTRLAPLYLEMKAAERHRARPMPRSGHQYRTNMPYVEYTRYDEQQSVKAPAAATPQQNEEIRRQRAVAKKSLTTSQTAPPARPAPPANAANAANAANNIDSSRVVYYTPKNAVRPYKMVPHQCSPKCKRTDVLALKDLRTYNPLAKPLLSGWERQIVRFKGHREVMYRAPCGRRVRNMPELHRYLRAVRSDMSVDLFDFGPGTHCLAEFVINKCLVGKKDLSHGKENVPVPCVNYYDKTLPEFCSYNTERTPTAGVPLNLDPEFLCGCDCDDDCEDKNKCACWKMTLEGARTIGLNGDVGYVYRRLPEPLPSGIYECNSRCKCKNTCLNRVAQHPLQLKLQVFKTMNRGWGIRALNDVPKGAFLCVYAGNLLTDATANLDGLNEGDEYLAELDYIEVVEQMKEGYEEDIPDSLKEPEKGTSESTEEEETSSSGEEEAKVSKDEIDDDFRPGYIDVLPVEFNKRLRTRNRRKKEKQNNPDKDKDSKDGTRETEKMKGEGEKENGEEDCITISDDEDVREPSRLMAQAGMDSKQLISKHRSVRSYFGKDEACYIMDAKVQGNIGRYLNHSCCPNVFVQNVFVDTHDPRFPWVAFFALSYIRAGTELTWNYNYDVGSVPGKVLYCYCGAPNCRGRLL